MKITFDHNYLHISFEALKVWWDLHSAGILSALMLCLNVLGWSLSVITGLIWITSFVWIPMYSELMFAYHGKIPLAFMLPFRKFTPPNRYHSEYHQVKQRLDFLEGHAFRRFTYGVPLVAPLALFEMYLLKSGKIAKLPKKLLYAYVDLQYSMYMELFGNCRDANHNYMDITDYLPPQRKAYKDLQDMSLQPDYSFYDYQITEVVDWEMVNGKLRKVIKRNKD